MAVIEPRPPLLDALRIGYSWDSKPSAPEHCLTHNDFQWADVTTAAAWRGDSFDAVRPHDRRDTPACTSASTVRCRPIVSASTSPWRRCSVIAAGPPLGLGGVGRRGLVGAVGRWTRPGPRAAGHRRRPVARRRGDAGAFRDRADMGARAAAHDGDPVRRGARRRRAQRGLGLAGADDHRRADRHLERRSAPDALPVPHAGHARARSIEVREVDGPRADVEWPLLAGGARGGGNRPRRRAARLRPGDRRNGPRSGSRGRSARTCCSPGLAIATTRSSAHAVG